MKTYIAILLIVKMVSGFEVDIDWVNQNTTMLTIGDKAYQCKIKNPPLSHGWAAECEENETRRLRGNHNNPSKDSRV